MLSNKYKWVVSRNGIATYLKTEPKKIRSGFVTKNGRRFVGENVKLWTRFQYETYSPILAIQ